MIGSLALALAGTPAMILTAGAEETQADGRRQLPLAKWPAETGDPSIPWPNGSAMRNSASISTGDLTRVPAYDNEWYSRNMYVKGSAAYKYHVAKYGGPEKFGYKDFIPQFTAEKFDADEWADLFQRAGAKFAGPVAEHADGWSNWDSKLTRWNAARMGPKKDITGLMAAAVRKRNMKFIATFHHQWLWGWYPTMDKTVDCSQSGVLRPLRAGRPAQRMGPEQSPAKPRVLRALAGKGQ